MPRIVDGDNLLGTWPGRKRSDADRKRLAHQVERLGRRERRRIVLVFDGPPPPLVPGRDVLFSGHGRKADALILDVLRREADRGGWIAVTDDRPLADQCRYLGVRVESCPRFRRRLMATGDREKPEQEDDVEQWLEVFGDEEGDPDA